MEFDDFFFRKLALGIGIAGILLLAAMSAATKPLEVSIPEINGGMLQKKVSTEGIVKNRFYSKNTLLFELADGKSIKAVVFSPTEKELKEIENSAVIRIEGTVQEYKGKIEIVAEKVKRID